MEFIKGRLDGLILIKPKIFKDNRGFFTETYKKNIFEKNNITCEFVQDNHSFSKKNVIRGMHFQKGVGQDKLVRSVKGRIFDVAVDIRKKSKTFGQWEGVLLDDTNCYQLFIPKGFAHGFCVISEDAHVCYKVSDYFQLDLEVGFNCLDNIVNIDWPTSEPVLSLRDLDSKSFEDSKKWFV